MSNRNANVWQMAFNASLQSVETKCQINHFISKCFFKITFLMIRKNWAHSHDFRDVVELAADCGAIKYPHIYLLRGYFRLKLSPTSRRCPRWLIFSKNLFYQNNCKGAINIVGGQIRGALFNFFVVKKCPFLYLSDAALSF